MKPTEGPYTVSPGYPNSPNGATIRAADNSLIATISRKADRNIEEKEANARLLAKSWEMREALAALVARFHVFTSDDRGGWGNQENAYYDLAKNAQAEWTNAERVLASIDGDNQ